MPWHKLVINFSSDITATRRICNRSIYRIVRRREAQLLLVSKGQRVCVRGAKLNCAACHAGAKLNIIHQSGVTCRGGGRPTERPHHSWCTLCCASMFAGAWTCLSCCGMSIARRWPPPRIRNIITLPHTPSLSLRWDVQKHATRTCKRQLNFSLARCVHVLRMLLARNALDALRLEILVRSKAAETYACKF